MSILVQASFLPKKLDQNPLLELVHLMWKDVINEFQMGKVGVEEYKERNK
jgi:hypothetical protein